MSEFFTYRQNNSGGSFQKDSNLAEFVVIEANGPTHANLRAEEIGIYFDGCEEGLDCSCCGDRWYKFWADEKGDEVPSFYGVPVEQYTPAFRGRDDYRIHYLNGEILKGFVEKA